MGMGMRKGLLRPCLAPTLRARGWEHRAGKPRKDRSGISGMGFPRVLGIPDGSGGSTEPILARPRSSTAPPAGSRSPAGLGQALLSAQDIPAGGIWEQGPGDAGGSDGKPGCSLLSWIQVPKQGGERGLCRQR